MNKFAADERVAFIVLSIVFAVAEAGVFWFLVIHFFPILRILIGGIFWIVSQDTVVPLILVTSPFFLFLGAITTVGAKKLYKNFRNSNG